MLLSKDDLAELRQTPPSQCAVCEAMVRKNYCRQCDEFFWEGHLPDCVGVLAHHGHHTYTDFEATIGCGIEVLVRETLREQARLAQLPK